MKAIFDAASPEEMTLVVNGVERTVRASPLRRLLDVLRDDFGLTGTKEGCGEGECGACTVLVDGEAWLSCLVAVGQVEGRRITTIEGSGHEVVQRSFLDCGGAQCGICTPGMILMTRAWLEQCSREGVEATEESARAALAGNLCRCTGYTKILEAALAAAKERA